MRGTRCSISERGEGGRAAPWQSGIFSLHDAFFIQFELKKASGRISFLVSQNHVGICCRRSEARRCFPFARGQMSISWLTYQPRAGVWARGEQDWRGFKGRPRRVDPGQMDPGGRPHTGANPPARSPHRNGHSFTGICEERQDKVSREGKVHCGGQG